MYQFTKDCMIGVGQIDKEHEYLFELINNAINALREDDVSRGDVTDLFRKLNDYAIWHFAHEEEYMMQINDPELPRQQEMHQSFINSLKEIEIKDITSTEDRETIKNILEFMSRWLFSHILGSDIMIGFSVKKDTLAEGKKDPFAFTDEYRTGIDMIDEEHQELFRIIKCANDLIKAELRFDRYDEILEVLNQLREYTIQHFGDEEAYMESIQYEGIEAQKKAHEVFVDKLTNINLRDLDTNQQGYLIDLVDFLLVWLVNHILKMDKRIPKK